MPRSGARVVSTHHRVVASLEAGAHTRATISAMARSRSGPAGPSSPGRPSERARDHTAATWPWGSERVTWKAASAST